MRLQRIPQRVSNCLSPFSSHFNCPQGQHFRVWCWLLVTLLLIDGSAKLKNLTRLMPASLRYWTVRRMVNAGYWNASAALDELVVATFFALPPPADGTLYLIGDKTIKQKSGKKQPLAHKTRMNEFARYVFGQEIVLATTLPLVTFQYLGIAVERRPRAVHRSVYKRHPVFEKICVKTIITHSHGRRLMALISISAKPRF